MSVGHYQGKVLDIKVEMSKVLLCKSICINHIAVTSQYP